MAIDQRPRFNWSAALGDWLERPHEFARLMGQGEFSPLHGEWMKIFLQAKRLEVLQAYRNSFKTTCGLDAIILIFLARPETRLLIARKTDTLAAQLVLAIQKLFETNAVLRLWLNARYGSPDVKTKEWSQEKTVFSFKRNVTVQPSITAAGVSSSLTGAHFDLIWCDDIVTREDRLSGAERAATLSFFRECFNLLEPGGSLILTGTPWHENDLFSTLDAKFFEGRRFPIGSPGLPPLTPEWIAAEKIRQGPSLWAANYELTHVHSEDVIGALHFCPGLSTPYRVAFIDPSFSNARGSDTCAAVVVEFDIQNGEIRFDGKAWEKSITHADVIREILLFLDPHKPIETCLESQLSDSTEIFLQSFRLAEITLGLRTKNNWTYKRQSANKHERIQSHVHANKPRLRAAQGIDPDFLRLVVGYHKAAEIKDPADALAGAIELWQTSPALQEYIKIAETINKLTAGVG